MEGRLALSTSLDMGTLHWLASHFIIASLALPLTIIEYLHPLFTD